MKFNNRQWHDSIIKSIYIDRNNPGIIDTVSFDIKWTNGKMTKLTFIDVYWASFNLNFGIIAQESILTAKALEKNDQDLINFYKKWKGKRDGIDLTSYLIELNSTGSTIKIIAKDFKFTKL